MKKRWIIPLFLAVLFLLVLAGCARQTPFDTKTAEPKQTVETSSIPATSSTVPPTTTRKPLTVEQVSEIWYMLRFAFSDEKDIDYISSLDSEGLAKLKENWLLTDFIDLTPFTVLTEEQKEEIKRLIRGQRFYEMMQIIDPTNPLLRRELTLQGVKDIINDYAAAYEKKEEGLPYYSEKWSAYSAIRTAIQDKQPFPDCEKGSGLQYIMYYLDGVGNEVLVLQGGSITYNKYADGEVVESVELYPVPTSSAQ